MRKRHWEAYGMILPGYTIYLIFVLIPILTTVYFSFTNYDLYKTKEFVGLANYGRLLEDPIFLKSLVNTLVYSLFTIFPPIALGLVIAVIVNGKVAGQRFHRVAMYIPHLTSMVSISMVWLWIYNPSLGILNRLMLAVGLSPQSWLFDAKLALPSIMTMSIWQVFGYFMIIYLAGLQTIPDHLYEAATIDGASKFRQFLNITIPMLRPTSFFLFVIATIQSFNVFDQVNVMTQGGPANATTTIVHQIYQRAFTNFQMGYASAMAVFLLCITLALTLGNFKFGNQGTDLETG